jgi:type I restriction enzyme S subunit
MERNQIDIPEGWRLKKLGSVCRIKKGVQFNKVELSDSGMFPCINGGIEPSGYSDLWNTIENTITISEGGNSCGYVNFLTTKFWSGGHCYSLLDLDKNLENDFLYQALKGRQSLIMDLRVGSGLPNIQQKAIKEFEFLSPESKSEQTQIASILSKVDEAISQTEQLIAKYTRIKTGLMQDLLTKGIDEHGNIRSEATHEFKDSPLGRIPKEWEHLRRYVIITGGYAFKSRDFTEDGLQLIRMGNLYNNQLSLNRDPVFLPKDFQFKHPNFVLKNGDLIMSMTGTSGKRDYGFTVQIEIEKPLLLNQRVCKFKCIENRIDKTYLINLLHSEIYLATLYENATGTKQANLNSDNILNIYVPFPSKDEQKRIGKKFNVTDKSTRYFYQELTKLQSLKTGLMQDLLTGKVRVNSAEVKEANETGLV